MASDQHFALSVSCLARAPEALEGILQVVLLEALLELAVTCEIAEIVLQFLEAGDGTLEVLEVLAVGGGLERALQGLVRAREVLQEDVLEHAEHPLLPVEHQLDVLVHHVVASLGDVSSYYLRGRGSLRGGCSVILWLWGRRLLRRRGRGDGCCYLRTSWVMLLVVPALLLKAGPLLLPQELLCLCQLPLVLGHL